MILSFGPELTWLYAYLTCDGNSAEVGETARLAVRGPNEELTDDTFPFEFSLRLKPTDTTAQLTFDAVVASGESLNPDAIPLGKEDDGAGAA